MIFFPRASSFNFLNECKHANKDQNAQQNPNSINQPRAPMNNMPQMGDNFNPNNQMGGHPQQQQQQSQQQQQQQPQQQPQHPNMPMPQINRSIANNIGLYAE